MDCLACGSAAVTERPERTARGYRRDCGKGYNKRSGEVLNHTQYSSDVIAAKHLKGVPDRKTFPKPPHR
ncbi:hypothetical protein SAMN02927895_00640 [Belnapia rosea]|uniref:Uncharacterized protein n=1 Tax=Belnapia rosea TaxID=938405 RepID=A0A1G6KAJ4_9PROT|nr:hypothetical protein SAMN02927895_00640 [Belnapia rosea]SDC28082.1 hypothetical protein SAMN04487779_1001450 [Belnapia rosea]